VWSTDLHAGPIGCQVSMFATLNIDVEAEVDVPNCKYFQNGRGENLCASGRGLRNDQNRGFSLDPHPNNTRRRLYTHFSANGDFSRADVVFCSHPAANCEIYLPFDKSILIYNTQRLEFGRDDEFVWWREPIIGADRRERWEHWVHNLKAISRSKANVVAANNMYDVTHMEYFTGIETKYIPSWCGGLPREIVEKSSYRPQHREIVLTPYRVNLEYAKETIPERGWPDQRRKMYKNPLTHPIFDDLMQLKSRFELISMKQAFPKHGKFKSIHDFQNFRAVVLIPYVPSTMFFFQLYRACVPILVPSRKLLARWVAEHGILWETSYGDPVRVNETMHSHLSNPSNFDAVSRERWMEFYDVYQTEVFPHILYFDNWERAAQIVESTNLETVSENMRLHNVNEFHRIRNLWRGTFEQMATNRKARGGSVSATRESQPRVLSVDINTALMRQYELEPLSFATESEVLGFFSRITRGGIFGRR